MDRFGIEAEPDTVGAADGFNLFEQWLSDHALSVVPDDYRVNIRDVGFERANQSTCHGSVDAVASFAVDADDLLLVRNNAGLNTGRSGFGAKQVFAADVLLS